MLSALNKALSKLPFNGKKTVLAAISFLLARYAPQVDPALVDTLSDQGVAAWQLGSEILLTIGILHAQIKKSLVK